MIDADRPVRAFRVVQRREIRVIQARLLEQLGQVPLQVGRQGARPAPQNVERGMGLAACEPTIETSIGILVLNSDIRPATNTIQCPSIPLPNRVNSR
jgi:hypothetical protein